MAIKRDRDGSVELLRPFNQLPFPRDFEGQREYFLRIEHHPKLQEEIENEIAAGNIGLVAKVAKKYTNKGLEYNDLVQEGYFGLRKAVRKYDYRQGYKLSTYAYFWIKQAITRAIDNVGFSNRPFRTPIEFERFSDKVHRFINEYCAELGVQPSEDEICEAFRDTAKNRDSVIDNIRRALQLRRTTALSLETPIETECGTGRPLSERIADTSARGDLIKAGDIIEKCLNELALHPDVNFSDRFVVIFIRIFGIQRDPETYAEVGRAIGISRSRVEQILKEDILSHLKDTLGLTYQDIWEAARVLG